MTDAREIMTATEMERALRRMAHEIIERNRGADDLLLAGVPTRGVFMATRLSSLIGGYESATPPAFTLDPTPFRDDAAGQRNRRRSTALDAQIHRGLGGNDVNGRSVVIVDDVFCTGRTARAAMDALMYVGRPATVQVAVLINRGHRELPISPDFVGKNIPTARAERVNVALSEVDGADAVSLVRPAGVHDA